MKGVANFLSLLSIQKAFSTIPKGAKVFVDFSKTRLVDLTTLETMEDYRRNIERDNGELELGGLEDHVCSSEHR